MPMGPNRKNRKSAMKRAETHSGKGKAGNASTHDGTATKSEFPTNSRDLGPRIVKLRK